MCQDILVEGESFSLDFDQLITETLVVESLPVAHHHAGQMVAPVKTPTQWKRVTAKGKDTSPPPT